MVPMVYRISFKVLPMVPLVIAIGTNGNANGTIGPPNGTNGKPMAPLATNGTIGKISNGTIDKNPERTL